MKKINVKKDISLREYQKKGVKWLLNGWTSKTGLLLADEMGLGKTVQTLGFLKHIFQKENNKGPFLIIAPLSCMNLWMTEFSIWIHNIKVINFQGKKAQRKIMKKHAMVNKKGEFIFNAIVTTFETVVVEYGFLSGILFQTIVIDEAHRLKNDKSKLYQILIKLKKKHTLLLTGTPIQNDPKELWSLLNLLDQTRFGDSNSFQERFFPHLQTQESVKDLHRLFSPIILRRLKNDVAKSKGKQGNCKVKERTIKCGMTKYQKDLYVKIFDENKELILGQETKIQSLVGVVLKLKFACNHPYLVKGGMELVKPHFTDAAKIFEKNKCLIESSGKMIVLRKLLENLKDDIKKLLILTQTRKQLDLIENLMSVNNYYYKRVDGFTRTHERKEIFNSFNKKEKKRTFLIMTTRAGMVVESLDVQIEIIFESDLNIVKKCYRSYGNDIYKNNKDKQVIRLVVENSIEEKLLEKSQMMSGPISVSDLRKSILFGIEIIKESRKEDDKNV